MGSMTIPARPSRLRHLRATHGRRISIRPIERSDADGLSDLYLSLSPSSRRSRFLGIARDEMVANAARSMATEPGYVAVLAELGPRDGAIVGHIALLPVDRASAEIAVAVADDHQRRGIGTRLVHAAVAEARRRGVGRIVASTLPENRGMRRLLLDAGCRVEQDALDACVEEFVLAV